MMSDFPKELILSHRDLRIDAFRGLSLLMILIDHIEWSNGVSIISLFTLHGVGLCDAAEVFVFLSGYVCGISYGRVLVNSGWWACQRKALRRAGQLYLANITTLFIILIVVDICLRLNLGTFDYFRLEGMYGPPSVFWPQVFLQIYLPSDFDILVLYMFLLVVLPVFLFSVIRVPVITFIIVIQVYLLAQFYPHFSYPQYFWHAEGLHWRTFTHPAWQLLFFSGSILGIQKLNGHKIYISHSVAIVCSIIIVCIAVIKLSPTIGYSIPEMLTLSTIERSDFADKWHLGPVRLIYFAMLLISADAFSSKQTEKTLNIVSKSLVGCGQKSLMIFCLVIIMTYLSHPVCQYFSNSNFTIVTFELFNCSILLIIGGFVFHPRTLRISRSDKKDLT